MRIYLIIILAATIQMVSAQDASNAPSKKEKIVWSATRTFEARPYDTARGDFYFRLTSVALVKHNVILWSVPLPERMTRYNAAIVYDRVEEANDHTDRKTRGDKIDINSHTGSFLTSPVLISKETITIIDRSGILVLARENGKVLVDIEFPKVRTPAFFVDQGTFKVKHKMCTRKGALHHGAEFLVQCGRYLVHFNGTELFLINRKDYTVERVAFDRGKHFTRDGLYHGMSMSHRSFRVKIRGRIFLK